MILLYYSYIYNSFKEKTRNFSFSKIFQIFRYSFYQLYYLFRKALTKLTI